MYDLKGVDNSRYEGLISSTRSGLRLRLSIRVEVRVRPGVRLRSMN